MTRTVWVKAMALAIASALSVAVAFSQSKGGGQPGTPSTGAPATGGTPTPGNNTPGRTTTPNPGTTTNPSNTISIPQPIFLSGRVALEDGSPLPEAVVIQSVCNGVAHSEGYTDSKGYFGIELGSNRGVIQDASEFNTGNNNPNSSGNMGRTTPSNSPMGSGALGMERRYLGCDLQAKLAGYR